jgi:MFS family permease
MIFRRGSLRGLPSASGCVLIGHRPFDIRTGPRNHTLISLRLGGHRRASITAVKKNGTLSPLNVDGNQQRSLRGLDWVNFFMADVGTGIGPFLAIYLTATRHWDPASIGMVVSAQAIASVVAQVPAGWLVDNSTRKKWLVISGAILVAAGCVGIVLARNVASEVAVQIVIGLTAAIFPPAIAAIALGIVGKSRLSGRAGRNEGFNHTGNVVFAVLAGLIGARFGQQWIFYASALFATGTVVSAWMIRDEDIDNEAARAADEGDKSRAPRIASLSDLIGDRRILIFTASVVLFHFANAAMLPLVGELLSKGHDGASSMYMSACIVVAQLVMIPVAILTGKLADPWGRKPLFLIGFCVLAVRGVLYTLGNGAIYLIAVQSLDGVGAAIFGVLWIIIISDLAKGTGRFNLLQGAIQAALGLGAFLSNFLAGFVVKSWGHSVGFLGLAGIALTGFAFFALFMPETKDPSTPEIEKASPAVASIS